MGAWTLLVANPAKKGKGKMARRKKKKSGAKRRKRKMTAAQKANLAKGRAKMAAMRGGKTMKKVTKKKAKVLVPGRPRGVLVAAYTFTKGHTTANVRVYKIGYGYYTLTRWSSPHPGDEIPVGLVPGSRFYRTSLEAAKAEMKKRRGSRLKEKVVRKKAAVGSWEEGWQPGKKRTKRRPAKKKRTRKNVTPAAAVAARKARAVPAVGKATVALRKRRAAAAGAAMTIAAAQKKSKTLAKRVSSLAKKKTRDTKRIKDLEKEVRSLRAKVGAARRRGDLTKAQEESLKTLLSTCQKRLTKCKAKPTTGERKAKKKKTKKKATRRAAPKKKGKKKAKKKAKKKRSRKKVISYGEFTRTEKTSVAKVPRRRSAAKKRRACPNPAKKKKAKKKTKKKTSSGAVKCKARPSKSSMAACVRASASWRSPKRGKHKKSSWQGRTCGPGAARTKAAAYLGGKQKGLKPKGRVTDEERRRIISRYNNLNLD